MTDQATSIDPRLVQLAKETANLPDLKKIVWSQIKQGTDVRYLALRYNLPLEDLLRAKAEHERREALRRQE